MYRVAIIGSRNLPEWALLPRIELALDYLVEVLGDQLVIVSGGAAGVDSYAEAAARRRGIPVDIFPADWNRFGKTAGMIRNRDIVTSSKLVIAFWNGWSRGTRHSIDLAKTLSIPVWVVEATG